MNRGGGGGRMSPLGADLLEEMDLHWAGGMKQRYMLHHSSSLQELQG